MHDDCPRVLSVLAARFGELDLADEAVQDALIDAARTWPTDGVPPNVGGWLMTTARRRALDRLRSAKRAQNRLDSSAHLLEEHREAPDVRLTDMIHKPHRDGSEDERLRLLLLCCHPALNSDTQVALTLRLVGGLTTAEISAAFLVPEATLAQRIVRAKNKIRTAGIPLSIPEQFTDRLGVVLAVLYLIFNEGYLSHDEAQDPIRPDLVDITELDGYHLLWASRGELCRRATRVEEARLAFTRALELAPNGAERRHLQRRLALLSR